MNAFVAHLRDRHEQALETAGDARSRLITTLEEDGPALASAMAEAAFLDAYARWWTTVIHHIDHAGLDPVTALSHARTTARRTLLEHSTAGLPIRTRYGTSLNRSRPPLLPRHHHPRPRHPHRNPSPPANRHHPKEPR